MFNDGVTVTVVSVQLDTGFGTVRHYPLIKAKKKKTKIFCQDGLFSVRHLNWASPSYKSENFIG
jgi:hypothetical protein